MEIFIYTDKSGVFDKNNISVQDKYSYGGLIFTNQADRNRFSNVFKINSAEFTHPL